MPELSEEFDDEKEPLKEKNKITLIQVLGIVIGMGVIIVLNIGDTLL